MLKCCCLRFHYRERLYTIAKRELSMCFTWKKGVTLTILIRGKNSKHVCRC